MAYAIQSGITYEIKRGPEFEGIVRELIANYGSQQRITVTATLKLGTTLTITLTQLRLNGATLAFKGIVRSGNTSVDVVGELQQKDGWLKVSQ